MILLILIHHAFPNGAHCLIYVKTLLRTEQALKYMLHGLHGSTIPQQVPLRQEACSSKSLLAMAWWWRFWDLPRCSLQKQHWATWGGNCDSASLRRKASPSHGSPCWFGIGLAPIAPLVWHGQRSEKLQPEHFAFPGYCKVSQALRSCWSPGPPKQAPTKIQLPSPFPTRHPVRGTVSGGFRLRVKQSKSQSIILSMRF